MSPEHQPKRKNKMAAKKKIELIMWDWVAYRMLKFGGFKLIYAKTKKN